jgi:bifunctional hydroxylase/dehydrase
MQPLREVLGELTGYEAVHRHLAGLVSGLEIRYPVGPGEHPLLGSRMPDLELAVEACTTSVFPLLRGARGLLLDLADDRSVRRCARPWADRVEVVTAKPAAACSIPRADAVLLRPDGHVAWASPGAEEELAAALDRWFGPPAAAAA